MAQPLQIDGALEAIGSDLQPIRAIADAMEQRLRTDSSGHDMAHAWRVFNVGVQLAETEGADRQIVGAAALTHDIHRIMAEDGEYIHPEESLPEVREILNETAFPAEKISAVCHCVVVHDEYEYKDETRPAETIEAKILRDADNLDAIGAVGVARCFAFNGIVGNPLWDPTEEEASGVGHFHEKLLKLKDEMNTDAAREIAKKRHEFLMTFIEQFEAEWNETL